MLLIYICVHFLLISWCTTLIYFLIGIMLVLISPLEVFFVSDKKGKNLFYWFFFDPFVDDWQKGGEVFEFICMFYVMHVFILVSRDSLFYVLLILVSRAWILVSRNIGCFFIGIKSITWLWYQIFLFRTCLCIAIHCIFLFICLCMS